MTRYVHKHDNGGYDCVVCHNEHGASSDCHPALVEAGKKTMVCFDCFTKQYTEWLKFAPHAMKKVSEDNK